MQADGQAGPSLGRQQGGDANAAQGNVQPMAGSRGANWALPSSSRGATPFNRPVRVVVSADQLTVLPDRGEVGEPRVTQLSGPMRNSIDGFVAHLWEHMNGWGVAGTQAYWKPILSVEVTRGGEKRFAELAALMQQSGVEVEWKR